MPHRCVNNAGVGLSDNRCANRPNRWRSLAVTFVVPRHGRYCQSYQKLANSNGKCQHSAPPSAPRLINKPPPLLRHRKRGGVRSSSVLTAAQWCDAGSSGSFHGGMEWRTGIAMSQLSRTPPASYQELSCQLERTRMAIYQSSTGDTVCPKILASRVSHSGGGGGVLRRGIAPVLDWTNARRPAVPCP